ncbi:hypothetical protein [Acuticoccus sediminis]|uniref:hypothetical protein n=1 Tax=Acuticoccus sediminis TaxID=2184697 RepID=UPI001CFE5881|nr:hypothetical protein [Acuticoccus sediminis]
MTTSNSLFPCDMTAKSNGYATDLRVAPQFAGGCVVLLCVVILVLLVRLSVWLPDEARDQIMSKLFGS